jgi:hypothetical protein
LEEALGLWQYHHGMIESLHLAELPDFSWEDLQELTKNLESLGETNRIGLCCSFHRFG